VRVRPLSNVWAGINKHPWVALTTTTSLTITIKIKPLNIFCQWYKNICNSFSFEGTEMVLTSKWSRIQPEIWHVQVTWRCLVLKMASDLISVQWPVVHRRQLCKGSLKGLCLPKIHKGISHQFVWHQKSLTYIWGTLPDGVCTPSFPIDVVGEGRILDASVVLSNCSFAAFFLNWTQHILVLEFLICPANTYRRNTLQRRRHRSPWRYLPWRCTQLGWSRCPPHPSRLYRMPHSGTLRAGRCWKKLQQDTLFVTMARRRVDLSQVIYSHLPILSFLETPLVSFVSISLASSCCAIKKWQSHQKYNFKIHLQDIFDLIQH